MGRGTIRVRYPLNRREGPQYHRTGDPTAWVSPAVQVNHNVRSKGDVTAYWFQRAEGSFQRSTYNKYDGDHVTYVRVAGATGFGLQWVPLRQHIGLSVDHGVRVSLRRTKEKKNKTTETDLTAVVGVPSLRVFILF